MEATPAFAVGLINGKYSENMLPRNRGVCIECQSLKTNKKISKSGEYFREPYVIFVLNHRKYKWLTAI